MNLRNKYPTLEQSIEIAELSTRFREGFLGDADVEWWRPLKDSDLEKYGWALSCEPHCFPSWTAIHEKTYPAYDLDELGEIITN